jgi:predicted Zn-dependent protease
MEQDPMLPDAYGLLGMARRDEGLDKIGEAEDLLREAVRLAPNDTVQVTRLAGMLIDVARIDASRQAPLRLEAKELLEARLKDDRESVEIPLLLAVLAREEGGNLERVEWLLKKIKKNDPKFKDSQHRVRLEFALLDLERGLLDAAERTVRELVRKDPSNHRVFGALARILESRTMLIPAYSEYKRAVDRTSSGSLARVAYEREMARLQKLIEEAAASLGEGESLPLPEELPEESGLAPVAFEDSAEAEAEYTAGANESVEGDEGPSTNESVESAEAGATEADAAPSSDEDTN